MSIDKDYSAQPDRWITPAGRSEVNVNKLMRKPEVQKTVRRLFEFFKEQDAKAEKPQDPPRHAL